MEDTKPEEIANGDRNASISVPRGESETSSKAVDTQEENVAESSIHDSQIETLQKDSATLDTSEARAGNTELVSQLKQSDISEISSEQARGESESTSLELEPARTPLEERQTIIDSTAKVTSVGTTEVSKTSMDEGESAESVPTTVAIASATTDKEMEDATSVATSVLPLEPTKSSSDENLPKDSGSENVVAAADASISTMEVEESAGNDLSTIAMQDKIASAETVNESVKDTGSKTLDSEKVHAQLAGDSSETASIPATAATETSVVATANSMEIEGPAENVARSVQDEIAEQQQLETEAVKNINKNSLSLLCQYSGSSESESEDVEESKTADNRKHSSPSSSSSDESEDEAADTGLSSSYRKCTDAILVSDAETMDTNAVSSDDDDDEDVKNQAPIRTKGEILVDELPPIEELTITVPETECKPIGLIDSIVAQIVLVQSIPGVELLNLDTVLFLDRGKRPLGKIFDVIGQVNCPIYCVLFNTNQEVVSKNITVGMQVYCAPRTEHTSFIILSELMRYKGSDASWMNDNEPPPHMVEYSDDEAEKIAKRNRKKKSNANGERDGENSQQPQQQQQYHHHQQQQRYHHQQSQQQQSQFPYMAPRPQFRRPPPNNRGHFNPQQRSGYSWHHNVNNPRYHNPQQQQFPQHQQQYPQQQQQYPQYQQQQFPPHQQQQQHFPPHQQQHQQPPPQQMQQFPNAQPGPGPAYLPNPFAMFGPHQPPNQQ